LAIEARGPERTRHGSRAGELVRVDDGDAESASLDVPTENDLATLTRELETIMNAWLKPHIQETEAGMEVTSYLPAELDRA
jgi:coenzyme PQQ precursor peptide PqqA